MTTQNATTNSAPTAEIHAIATEASTYYVRGNGAFTSDAIWALRASLEKLTDSPELGPAVAALVMVAGHLDQAHGAKAAANALLQLATTATPALEAQVRKAQEQGLERRRSFDGSKPAPRSAPVFGARAPQGAVPLRALNTPKKIS